MPEVVNGVSPAPVPQASPAPPTPPPPPPVVRTDIYPINPLAQAVGQLRKDVVRALHDGEEGDVKVAEIDREIADTQAAAKQAADDKQRVSDFLYGELKDRMELLGVSQVPGWEDTILPMWNQDPTKGYDAAKKALRAVKAAQVVSEKPAPPPETLVYNETSPKAAPPDLDAMLKTPTHTMSPTELQKFTSDFKRTLGIKET